jgi:hypothetical protein
MTEILYQDKQVTVYKELIVINKYYFPLATSKTILFADMESAALITTEGVTHRWGICGKYLNNWFPLDPSRKNKEKFIEITLKGKAIKPSITPDDPDKVLKIIWENHTKEGQQYVERMSEQAGKETEIAQQEMMEREKEFETSEQQLGNVKKVEE